MNKKRELFRNKTKGKVGGVCAGLADYFGWETWLIRIIVISAILLGSGFVFVAYIAAWFILDKKEDHIAHQQPALGARANEENSYQPVQPEEASIKVKARIWQKGEPPRQAFHDIRLKFKRLEGKLVAIERYVTSTEFSVSREINKL